MVLSKDANYLTFNYTDTLETIYDIPKANILHIHGARGTGDDYIVGHSNYRDDDKAYDDNDILFKQQTRAKIIGWMNNQYKDSEAIASYNDSYFRSLSNIQQVIVLGHSLNKVDLPYFKKIAEVTGVNTLWEFSFYERDDIDNIKRFIAGIGLKNTKIIHFDGFCIA